MRLVDSKTKQPLEVGQMVTTSRGEKCKLLGITRPHKPSSTGRVTLQFDSEQHHYTGEFFPGVIDAEWIEREDHPQ